MYISEIALSTVNRAKVTVRIQVAFVLCLVLSKILHAAPVTLTDTELDHVSAGYVDLEVTGQAIANGPSAVARFAANVEQTIVEPQSDNYIYTTTTGLADAFAKGRRVSTEVGYFFQTDEEVLTFEATQKVSSRNRVKKGNKKNKSGSKKTNKNRKESSKPGGKKKASNSRNKQNRGKSSDRKTNQTSKNIKNKRMKAKGKGRVVRERQQLHVTVVTRRKVD